MCGIVGYAGQRPALPILLAALRDLEYRGYDSAGVAVMSTDADGIAVRKREGKIANLEAALEGEPGMRFQSLAGGIIADDRGNGH